MQVSSGLHLWHWATQAELPVGVKAKLLGSWHFLLPHTEAIHGWLTGLPWRLLAPFSLPLCRHRFFWHSRLLACWSILYFVGKNSLQINYTDILLRAMVASTHPHTLTPTYLCILKAIIFSEPKITTPILRKGLLLICALFSLGKPLQLQKSQLHNYLLSQSSRHVFGKQYNGIELRQAQEIPHTRSQHLWLIHHVKYHCLFHMGFSLCAFHEDDADDMRKWLLFPNDGQRDRNAEQNSSS